MAFWTNWFKKREPLPEETYLSAIEDLQKVNQALSAAFLLLQKQYEGNKNSFVIWLGAAIWQYGSGKIKLNKEFIELMSTNPNIQIQVTKNDEDGVDLTAVDVEEGGEDNESDSDNSV